MAQGKLLLFMPGLKLSPVGQTVLIFFNLLTFQHLSTKKKEKVAKRKKKFLLLINFINLQIEYTRKYDINILGF